MFELPVALVRVPAWKAKIGFGALENDNGRKCVTLNCCASRAPSPRAQLHVLVIKQAVRQPSRPALKCGKLARSVDLCVEQA